MEKSYKFRIYPNKEQQIQIQKTFGCCRFVYNFFLNRRMNAYAENKETIRFYQCSRELTKLKQEFSWLQEPDKWALQNVLKDLDFAYQMFFKTNNNFPKFKSKKNHHQSYRTQDSLSGVHNRTIMINGNHIKLPKLGYLKTRDKIAPSGRILNATVLQEPNGHYYVIICCTDVEIKPFPKTNTNIGIDLGIKNFAVFSDGFEIPNPKFFEKSQQKITKLHKELMRKSIGGSNRKKARIKLAKEIQHVKNQRTDFLQKLTTNIVKTYDIICIEDLDVKGMKIQNNSMANKHINDVGFYSFRKMLEYKCKWYGKELRVVNRYYPSTQICNKCNEQDSKKTVNIRIWVCPNCGSVLDRDVNAAINILNEGLNINNC